MATNNTSLEIGKKLNESVVAVIGQDKLLGFEKAYLISEAIGNLKAMLSPAYMKPIMELQGNRLGFKTDKDKDGGYPEAVVKNCLIEAVLMGVQPHNNQFNIIAGNSYITKEGYGHLLSKIPGLQYEIVFDLPRMNEKSAAVVAKIFWTINGGEKKERSMDIPVKVNSFMGSDAVLGKATRKARAWLYNTITGNETPDGDITEEGSATVMGSKPLAKSKEQIESERIQLMISDCKTIVDLELLQGSYPEIDIKLFDARKEELKNGK